MALGVPIGEIRLDTIPGTAVEVARIAHDIDTVVTFMNKESDNLTAETLLKTLAAVRRGTPGSATAGVSVLHEFLSANGIDTTKVIIVDGSGLSRYDLTSAEAVTKLLVAMYGNREHFETFYHSLPIAGVDGTLARRMRGTPAEGNLHAKTGTLSGVSALSGYVRTAEGELLAFSVLTQNYPSNSRGYRLVQDRIGVILSSIRRSDF
jgi:D-alanyl-D-alanine carboxypeptidase/D-alanyl-D-alanine-endopeptidase (penicillin-binding protein 4)